MCAMPESGYAYRRLRAMPRSGQHVTTVCPDSRQGMPAQEACKTACVQCLTVLSGLALPLHSTSGKARPRGHTHTCKEGVCQSMTMFVVRVTGRSKCI